MLNIEVIKFEAQDVITASCTCKNADFCVKDENGKHIVYNLKYDDAGEINGASYKPCPADTHTGCKNPPAMG